MLVKSKFLYKSVLFIFLGLLLLTSTFISGLRKTNNFPLKMQSTPQIIEISHISNTGGETFQAFARDNLLFVMDMNSGIKIYNIDEASNPELIGSYDDNGLPHNMQLVDDLLYLADHDHGLEIFNINNPTTPVKLGSIKDIGDGQIDGVFVHENFAYVAEWHDSTWDWSMKIINISDSTHPQEICEYRDDDNEFIRFFTEDNKILFAACLDSGFKILNVTIPTNITEIAHYNNLNGIFNFVTQDNLIYLVNQTKLLILNIGELTSPIIVGQFNTTNPTFGIKVNGDIAFLAVQEIGLFVLNVSNPNNIQKVGEFNLEEIFDIDIQGNLIFVTMHEHGLKILEISWFNETNNIPLYFYLIIFIIPILFILKKKNRI